MSAGPLKPVVRQKTSGISWPTTPALGPGDLAMLSSEVYQAIRDAVNNVSVSVPGAPDGSVLLVDAAVRIGIVNPREYFGGDDFGGDD